MSEGTSSGANLPYVKRASAAHTRKVAHAVVAATPQPFAKIKERMSWGQSSPAAIRESSVAAYHQATDPSGGQAIEQTARNSASTV